MKYEEYKQKAKQERIKLYAEMLSKQENKCAICGNFGVNEKLNDDIIYGKMISGNLKNYRRLAIDHNHLTDEIRGLLCTKCNLVLGLVNDDVSILQKNNLLSRYRDKRMPNLKAKHKISVSTAKRNPLPYFRVVGFIYDLPSSNSFVLICSNSD